MRLICDWNFSVFWRWPERGSRCSSENGLNLRMTDWCLTRPNTVIFLSTPGVLVIGQNGIVDSRFFNKPFLLLWIPLEAMWGEVWRLWCRNQIWWRRGKQVANSLVLLVTNLYRHHGKKVVVNTNKDWPNCILLIALYTVIKKSAGLFCPSQLNGSSDRSWSYPGCSIKVTSSGTHLKRTWQKRHQNHPCVT
jgi:hypothetical protein